VLPVGPATEAAAKPRTRPVHPVWRVLKSLASLRLTVVLFVLSFMLVFLGTLAQVDEGTWSVVSKYFRWWYVWIPFQTLVRFGQTFFGVSKEFVVPGAFPFPGGWTLGGLLLVNLLAAHAVRFRISWKRSGILMLHAGLILMMVGEFITGVFAVEGNLTIRQGGQSDCVEEHKAELAVVDRSDPENDNHVVIPESKLKEGETIRHDLLPFDIEIIRYMPNSIPKDAAESEDNPASNGAGLAIVAEARPVGKGVQSDQKSDMPSAYVLFREKETGKPLGTWLLSRWLGEVNDVPDQQVSVGGKSYSVALRMKRSYKPYTMHLIELTHDTYPGTDTPRNFASLVRLEDKSTGEDREVLISMNEPLRYHGETFYQSQMRDAVGVTVLQVVRNPASTIPYISCVVVGLGMLIHFGIHLIGFLQRKGVL
jgi:hypothetical protein